MRRHTRNAESREGDKLRHGRCRRHLREDGGVPPNSRHQHRRARKAHRHGQEEAVVRAERAEGDEGGRVPEALRGPEGGPEELREPGDDRRNQEDDLPG